MKILARESGKMIVEITADEARKVGIVLSSWGGPTTPDKDAQTILENVFSRHERASLLVVREYGKFRLTREVLERIDKLLEAGREVASA